MKTAIALLALAITATTPAAGREPMVLRLLPPPEYDHPYLGHLYVSRPETQAEVREP
jgi:hypothetical protein